ncbi:MAG: glycosyltransferase family 39 protein [Anaerolineales bacterium]|nr:glycosyltransferase family 39 protein [Anaerolineales bacterium]
MGLLFRLFGPSLFIAKVANVIFAIWILFFAYYIAKTLFGSELCGRVTLLILAFYPDHIAYTSLLASEILFLFLFLLGVVLLIAPGPKIGLAVIAGIVFGLACLVKPQALLVPAILFAVLWASRARHKTLVEYGLGFIIVYLTLGLTILPWLIRNYQVFNHVVFISTNGGYNLLVGNHPAATGAYNFSEALVFRLSDAQNEFQRDRKAFQLAVDYMVAHPLETIQRWPKKLWHLYGRDTKGLDWNMKGLQGDSNQQVRALLDWLEPIVQIYYTLIMAGFLLSVFLLFKKAKTHPGVQPFPTLGLWLAFYFTLISLLTFGNSRFHLPIIPWMVMYVGAWIALKSTLADKAGPWSRVYRGVLSGIKSYRRSLPAFPVAAGNVIPSSVWVSIWG